MGGKRTFLECAWGAGREFRGDNVARQAGGKPPEIAALLAVCERALVMECHSSDEVHVPGDLEAPRPRSAWLLVPPCLSLQMVCSLSLGFPPSLLYKDLSPTYDLVLPLTLQPQELEVKV